MDQRPEGGSGGLPGRAVMVAGVAAGMLVLPGTAAAEASTVRCDLDGDGRGELVLGAPGDTVYLGDEPIEGAGTLHVRYSIDASMAFYQQSQAGVPAEAGNRFGASFACGDFDGNGFDDLAIGVPGWGGDAGAVVVMGGSVLGIIGGPKAFFRQGAGGVPGQAEPGDQFGHALAAGDFDGDGLDDLAVGIPGEDVRHPLLGVEIADTGSVQILRGSTDGLQPTPLVFHVGAAGVFCSGPEASYGAALAAGDFNADGIADLAVGAPNADVRHEGKLVSGAGSAHVMAGSLQGLSTEGNACYSQAVLAKDNGPRSLERFGWALAAGDFDNRGHDDLAIGVPHDLLFVPGETLENWGEFLDVGGSVNVLYSSGSALDVPGNQLLTLETPDDLGGDPQKDARFGFALAAVDFQGGPADLLVGVPGYDPGGYETPGAGAVVLMLGWSGWGLAGGWMFDQDQATLWPQDPLPCCVSWEAAFTGFTFEVLGYPYDGESLGWAVGG